LVKANKNDANYLDQSVYVDIEIENNFVYHVTLVRLYCSFT